jgi:hypothetical protein
MMQMKQHRRNSLIQMDQYLHRDGNLNSCCISIAQYHYSKLALEQMMKFGLVEVKRA